jgi:hypothetical protein
MKNLIAFIRALVIYLPTTVFVPNAFFAISIFFLINKEAFYFTKKEAISYLFILLFIILALINFMTFTDATISKSRFNFIPNDFFWLFLIPFCKTVNKKTIIFLVIFILLEIFLGFLLFTQERQTFFAGMEKGIREFGSEGLLYYSRVFGISNNSSDFAYKIFAAIILTSMIEIDVKHKILLNLFFVAGLFITFNRTTLITTFIFFSLLFIRYEISRDSLAIRTKKGIILFLCLIPFSFIIIIFHHAFVGQFSRGIGVFNFSGERIFIWKIFLQEWMSNFIIGNGSTALWIDINLRLYHAHNSFLQLLATHGFILSSLFMIALGIVINKKTLIFIIPIFLISMLQYGIFWNYSILDFLFFYTLFKFSNDTKLFHNHFTSSK